jgi:hypothetical protein
VLRDQSVPRAANELGAVAEIPDQRAGMQFGDEALDDAVINSCRHNAAQTAPAGET